MVADEFMRLFFFVFCFFVFSSAELVGFGSLKLLRERLFLVGEVR